MEKGVAGFFEAKVTMRNGVAMGGVPVQVTVAGAGQTTSVFSSTGATPARLPLHEFDPPGEYIVTAKELLTGLSSAVKVSITTPPAPPKRAAVRLHAASDLAKFAARKHVALTIALTPEQLNDPKMVEQAKVLADFYRGQRRVVAESFGRIAPGGMVESLQPLKSPHRYPQWKTIASDLVLIGLPSNNVLLLDQARAHVFPRDLAPPAAGECDVISVRSAFVGEYDVINILANDLSGVTSAVKAITSLTKPR